MLSACPLYTDVNSPVYIRLFLARGCFVTFFAFLVLNKLFFYLVENSTDRQTHTHTHTENWDFGSILVFPASASRFLGGEGGRKNVVFRDFIFVCYFF